MFEEWLPALASILTILITLGGGAFAYARTVTRSEGNKEAIKNLEKRIAIQEAHHNAAMAELKNDFKDEVNTIHRRYDKHQEHIATAIADLSKEMRNFHIQIGGLRETIAALGAGQKAIIDVQHALERMPERVAEAIHTSHSR